MTELVGKFKFLARICRFKNQQNDERFCCYVCGNGVYEKFGDKVVISRNSIIDLEIVDFSRELAGFIYVDEVLID